MIDIKEADIYISETTLKSLLRAIEEAKESREFVDEPMPQKTMSSYQWDVEFAKRGHINVSSRHCGIRYKIDMEVRPHSQESLGYELDDIPEPEATSCTKGFTLLGSSDDVAKENN